jgi:hypothetical protein
MGFFVVMVMLLIVVIASMDSTDAGSTDAGSTDAGGGVAPAAVKWERPSTIIDCGYANKAKGWYDVVGQGYKNDYCRYVGDSPFFSCQLSDGSTNYTPEGDARVSEINAHMEFVSGTHGC